MGEEFIQLVVKWLKLDDSIKKTIVNLKEMKETKKKFEEVILEKMNQSNQEILSMSSGGSIRRTVSKTKGALKQEYINQVLIDYIKDKNEADILTESIMKNRPINERQYLKRTNPRKKDTN